MKLVKAIQEGRIKVTRPGEENKEEDEKKKPTVYMLWKDEDETNEFRRKVSQAPTMHRQDHTPTATAHRSLLPSGSQCATTQNCYRCAASFCFPLLPGSSAHRGPQDPAAGPRRVLQPPIRVPLHTGAHHSPHPTTSHSPCRHS